jgi:hypothetical protein
MNLVIEILVFAHLMGLALGFAGGLGMSQVGPRLVAAGPAERAPWWPLANALGMMANIGLVLLLASGPAIVWLKYAGFGGMRPAFWVKMALILAALVTIGLSERGKAQLKRGDERGGRLMMKAGPATGVIMVLIVLSAVFAFD